MKNSWFQSDFAIVTQSRRQGHHFTVLNRIAIEELEAWYFGDWEAVQAAFPRVQATTPQKSPYRDADAVQGGTWERFEHELQKVGYFKSGLRKIEAAQKIGPHIAPGRNTSRSFQVFRDALEQLVSS